MTFECHLNMAQCHVCLEWAAGSACGDAGRSSLSETEGVICTKSAVESKDWILKPQQQHKELFTCLIKVL